MLKVKSGVTPRLIVIAAAAANVSNDLGLTLVVTSGTDGKHMKGSKHYTGEALDIRRSNIASERVSMVCELLRARLGKNYDVVLERTHIHVEYDPK
jgi:hypothetical protein